MGVYDFKSNKKAFLELIRMSRKNSCFNAMCINMEYDSGLIDRLTTNALKLKLG